MPPSCHRAPAAVVRRRLSEQSRLVLRLLTRVPLQGRQRPQALARRAVPQTRHHLLLEQALSQ